MDSNQQYTPSYLAENVSWQLKDVAIAFGILETVFAILFFVSRYLNRTVNGLDFYLMTPAYIMSFGQVIVIILSIIYGGSGRHVAAVSPETLITFMKLELVVGFTYQLSTSLPKLAILCLYERIFTTRMYRHAIGLTALVIILYTIGGLISTLAICRPFAYNWNKTIQGGHCGDVEAFCRWINIPNLVTDVMILILPVHVVWRLHTGIGNKIGLTLTFLTGCIGILTASARLVIFFTTDMYADPTYIVKILIWDVVEPGVYFIAATLPSLRPLLHYIFKDLDFKNFFKRIRSYYSRAFSMSRKNSGTPLADVHSTSATTDRIAKMTGRSGARSAGFDKLDEHKSEEVNLSLDDENNLKMLHTCRERWENEEANRLPQRPQCFAVR